MKNKKYKHKPFIFFITMSDAYSNDTSYESIIEEYEEEEIHKIRKHRLFFIVLLGFIGFLVYYIFKDAV